ncbi:uncharacterized protein LOC126834793 [Adelges cooleyi]|uniref:uncharacterized protein LOC126834793 n=1 Tax=Adelges cooleyi TaxID=133065 RepID=UPI00218057FF|nr:uncharacterized protein LOC126834793 [Adelges cooleyi]
MVEKDIIRQILSGYINREITLENELKELTLNSKKTSAVFNDDFFRIRRDQLVKQKNSAKKRNEAFLKELEQSSAKLRATLACDDLLDKRLDEVRTKFFNYMRNKPAKDSKPSQTTSADDFT